MNLQSLSLRKFNLLEKKNLASRIVCVAFILVFGFYLFGGQPPVATIISIVVILLLSVQFLFQFNAANGILGGLMFLLSLYFSIAVLSEFNEFEVVNSAARNLLIFGWGACLAGIILSIFLIVSFIRDFVD